MWTIFWIITTCALTFDLVILNKHHSKLSNRQSFFIALMWIVLALIFCGIIFYNLGSKHAYEFLTGYLIEYSLSIDNLFIFISIFSYFKLSEYAQQKALTFGIIGAIIMRFIFIFAGIQLISTFHWLFYVFGAILVYTSIKMLKSLLTQSIEHQQITNNKILTFIGKILPISTNDQSENLIISHNGKIFFTKTMIAIITIEICDFTFAIDSIPAVLSITQNELIIYSSNIFAIIGLRSMYFVLHQLSTKFRYLKHGIAAILLFIGIKMLLVNFIEIPTLTSLFFIISAITISVIASQIKKRPEITRNV